MLVCKVALTGNVKFLEVDGDTSSGHWAVSCRGKNRDNSHVHDQQQPASQAKSENRETAKMTTKEESKFLNNFLSLNASLLYNICYDLLALQGGQAWRQLTP